MKLYKTIDMLLTSLKEMICNLQQFILESLSTNGGIYEASGFWDYINGIVFLSIIISMWILILPVIPFIIGCVAVKELKQILIQRN